MDWVMLYENKQFWKLKFGLPGFWRSEGFMRFVGHVRLDCQCAIVCCGE